MIAASKLPPALPTDSQATADIVHVRILKIGDSFRNFLDLVCAVQVGDSMQRSTLHTDCRYLHFVFLTNWTDKRSTHRTD